MIDFTTILFSIFSQILYFIPIALIILFFKSPLGKGIVGESLVNIFLNIRLNKQEYHLLKDITLPTENGTTQIDHIVISEFGIFVIETKNMKGWIFGGEHQKTWTQKIYKQSRRFQNPLYQNYKHVKTIESILDIDPDKIFSVIVFVGKSTFKTEMPINVTYPSGLIHFIESKTHKVLSQNEVERVISMIKSGKLSKSFKTHREHVKHVKNIIKEKGNTNCPKCGNVLVLRIAKQGVNKGNKFYGCSNFPKCRYTLNALNL